MTNIITRVFRIFRAANRRRPAVDAVTGAPTQLQPGELAYGDAENKLYIGRDDGSVAVVGSAGGDGVPNPPAGHQRLVWPTGD